MHKIFSLPEFVWPVAPDEQQVVQPHAVNSPQFKPTPLDVAVKYGWKVGEKDVRVIGHGKMPDLGQKVMAGDWLVMRVTDYSGIVPQEALERLQILRDEGVSIKGLLIAEDPREQKKHPLRELAEKAKQRFKAIDWKKRREQLSKSAKDISSAVSHRAEAVGSSVKKEAQKVDWNKVRGATWTGVKVLGVGVGCLALATALLPLLALAAIPVAAVTFDPWLIVVDPEGRWWVVAEWWE